MRYHKTLSSSASEKNTFNGTSGGGDVPWCLVETAPYFIADVALLSYVAIHIPDSCCAI